MTLRIVNTDGMAHSTRVVDLGTGQELQHVARIEVDVTPDNFVACKLHVTGTHLEVLATDPVVSISWREYKRLKLLAGEKM